MALPNHAHRYNVWAIRAIGLTVWVSGFILCSFTKWLEGLSLILLGGTMLAITKWWRSLFTLPTTEEAIIHARAAQSQKNEVLARETTPKHTARLTVGTVQGDSDYFPAYTGIMTPGNQCAVSEYLLDRHILILGEIGAGKTTATLTLMQQAGKYTNRDLFFINFKGQQEDNENARRIMSEHRSNVRIVRIDPDNPGWKYNPFKHGDGLSIANRWIRILGIENYEGSGEYYADLHRAAILLLCLAGEPPRSLEEMRNRLDPVGNWLKAQYPAYHPDRLFVDLLLFNERGQLSPWQKLIVKVIPLMKQLERFIGEDGLTFDDGSLIITVPASKIPDTAKKVADCIVEDLKHYMSTRQKREAQIFWDEFQAARNESITEFLSQARSFHCGAVLTTQDINKLGSELQQKVLSSDTTTLIAFRTQQSADFVARFSGSVKRSTTTMHIEDGYTLDSGSVREETEYRVMPNAVAQLPDGYCYIIRQRLACKVLFTPAIIPTNVLPEPVYTPSPAPVSMSPKQQPASTPQQSAPQPGKSKSKKAKVNKLEI